MVVSRNIPVATTNIMVVSRNIPAVATNITVVSQKHAGSHPDVYKSHIVVFAVSGVRSAPLCLPSTARSMMVGRVFLVLTGACQFGHGVGGFTTNFIHSLWADLRRGALWRATAAGTEKKARGRRACPRPGARGATKGEFGWEVSLTHGCI